MLGLDINIDGHYRSTEWKLVEDSVNVREYACGSCWKLKKPLKVLTNNILCAKIVSIG